MRLTTLFIALAILTPTGLQAAKFHWPYRNVTLILPRNLDYPTVRFMAFPAETLELRADDNGKLIANGFADWSTRGFPSRRQCTAVRPDTTKRVPGKVRMILNCDGGTLLVYAATTDFAVAISWFTQIFVPGKKQGPEVEAYLGKWRPRMADALFSEAGEDFPAERRLAVIELAEQANATSLQNIDYRDSRYLQIDLGLNSEVFNTIQLRQTQRLARVVGQRLLSLARQTEEALANRPEISGLALKVEVPFKNFVTGGEAGSDQLELLMTRAELGRFVRDEITSQQLLGASVIRVNGGRVEVDLSQN